jgi:hypothetical protein
LTSIAFIPFTQAVADKEGIYTPKEKKWGDEIIAAIAQKIQESSREFELPLKVVERESVAAIMKEKDLIDAGLAEENKAVQLGKLAKAQAICYGRVVIDIRTVEGQSKTLKFYPGRRSMNVHSEPVKRIKRTISVSATVKLVETATGKSIITFNRRSSQTADLKPGMLMGEDAQEINLRPEEDVIERLITTIVDEFVGQIVPYEVRYEVKIVKPKGKLAKGALKYLRIGEYEKAENLFREGLEVKPDDHGAWYDLGLIYEIKGNLKEAQKCFMRAYNGKEEDVYYRAVKRVREKQGLDENGVFGKKGSKSEPSDDDETLDEKIDD